MRTSMLFRKQLLGVDCTLPHDLSLFSIMIYSTTSPAEAIESNVLAYFKHDLKSYILNDKFVASYLNRRCPSESTVSSSSPLPSAYGDGLACPLGSPMATAIGPLGEIRLRCFGYCAQGRNTPPRPCYVLGRKRPCAHTHGFFSMATMPETMAPKLDRHNERSLNQTLLLLGE